MEKFKVKKKHLTGEIADFPKRVVQAMVDEQVRQGNPADPSVFARDIRACKPYGGFSWHGSTRGFSWVEIIREKKFHLVPKREKPRCPDSATRTEATPEADLQAIGKRQRGRFLVLNNTVTEADLQGEIADFPLHVVKAMCDEQVKQGNPFNPSVFRVDKLANRPKGGFTWEFSKKGHGFWHEIINRRDFDLTPSPKAHPPKTIRIGEYDVPAPVREPLEDDKEYWGVDPMAEELAWKYKWNNALFCNLMFRRGLIHLTKEAAVIHAKALLSLTTAAD